jgi:hypothetical protein
MDRSMLVNAYCCGTCKMRVGSTYYTLSNDKSLCRLLGNPPKILIDNDFGVVPGVTVVCGDEYRAIAAWEETAKIDGTKVCPFYEMEQ